MKKRVAIYLRVSTIQQSFEIQERDLLQYSSHRNFQIYKIYKEKVSGGKRDRPELNKLLVDAKRRRFDICLVWRFDRAARSTSHLLFLLEEFNNMGVDFISYQEAVDTTSSLGKMIFTVLASVSELEKNLIRERVIAGINNARAKGKKLGRPKKRDDDKIRQMRANGMSYRTIANQLNISVGAVQRSLKPTLSKSEIAQPKGITKS